MWDWDKPHRCPECHYVWVREYGLERGHWWLTYQCHQCGTRFTGRWAWWPKTYYSARFRLWHWYRELKWRMAR